MPAISVTSLCSAAESIYVGNTLNFLIFPEFVPLWLSFESSLLHLWFLKTLSGSEHRPWLFCGFLCFQALLVVDDNGAVRSNIWSPLSGRILTGQRFSNSVFNPRSHGQLLPNTQYHHPTPSINFHHLGHQRSSWWDGTWSSTSTTVPKVILTVAAQYQYWASNEINQMLMDPNNEIGINANIAAISIAHLNPPVVESRGKKCY